MSTWVGAPWRDPGTNGVKVIFLYGGRWSTRSIEGVYSWIIDVEAAATIAEPHLFGPGE